MLKMKLISCILLCLLIEIHNARRRTPANVIRIPLRAIRLRREDDSKNATSRIDVDDTHDINLGRISIGEPEQHFDVIFDTGSPQLWVFSGNYDTCDPHSETVFRKQKLYNLAASTTYQQPLNRKKEPKPQLIIYSLQWVFGYKAIDNITLGGKKIKKEFLEVTKSTEMRANAAPNGIMGLKYDPEKGNIVTNFCDEINGEHKFSFYLPKVKGAGKDNKGELLLCGVDKSKYKEGTMRYIKEQSPGLWTITMNKVTAEGSKGNYRITAKNLALFDTGANPIVAPLRSMTRFFNDTKDLFDGKSEEKEIDCTKRDLLPNITFHTEGKHFTLTGMDYTRNISNVCKVALYALDIPNWILGEPFLRKFYTVFDMKNHRIGIAESKG